jgi:hypothetical protein
VKKTYWLFIGSFESMFRTYWGKFGWGDVPLLGAKPYRWIGIVGLVALIGSIIGFMRRLRIGSTLPWDSIIYMLVAIFLVWISALLRGAIYLTKVNVYLPVGRYAYTAIAPVMLFLSQGMLDLLYLFRRWLPRLPEIVYISLLVIFNLVAFVTIYRFYY